jgi:NADH-quinone oxidoreductase subunit N
MNTTPQVLRILPEVILTVVGVVIMLVEPLMAKGKSRKSLGWFAVIGMIAALAASLYQYQLPAGTAYFNTVRTDAFSVFFHVLLCGISLVCLLITLDATTAQTEGMGEFYALAVFGTVGMLFMTCAVELLLVFIGLEISSISTYILAGFRKRSAKGPESAIKYFLLGSFATAFFLYGIALTFGATGTTRIDVVAGLLGSSATPLLAIAGLAMIIIGLGFKVSAAPFQVWTPDVYEGAPSPVVALMSTGPKAAAFAVLLRVLYGAFPALHAHWVPVLWWLAVLSMFVGNLGALRQRNVKRLLAYSSIAHAGYLLVAFTALTPDGIAAASFYAVSYAAMQVGVFAAVSHAGQFDDRLTLIEDYRGLAYRTPIVGGAMAFFLISLIGIPFTGGFFGKFYVFTAAIHSGFVWLAILGLINSGIAAFYYLRLLAALYTRPSESSPVAHVPRATVPMLFALLLTVAATLILGIVPGRVLAKAKAAAETYPAVGANPQLATQETAQR